MGVCPSLSPPVHCGQLLREAVADASSYGEAIRPFFEKKMAGRPHLPRLLEPSGLRQKLLPGRLAGGGRGRTRGWEGAPGQGLLAPGPAHVSAWRARRAAAVSVRRSVCCPTAAALKTQSQERPRSCPPNTGRVS